MKIEIDFSQDNSLIAISCHKKDYWLAYRLNETMRIHFRRIKDFGVYHSSLDRILEYPIYYFTQPDTAISWYLIANYHPDGKMFSALRTTDFILLICGPLSIKEIDDIVTKTKGIKGLLLAQKVDHDKLKDVGNFLSDLELHMMECLKS